MSACTCDEATKVAPYTSKTRTAQKIRLCEEVCGQIISVGTCYVSIVGKSLRFSTCLDCNGDWEMLLDIVEELGGEPHRCFGRLRETIEEAFNDGYLDNLEDEDVARLLRKASLTAKALAQRTRVAGSESGYTDYVDKRQLHLAFA